MDLSNEQLLRGFLQAADMGFEKPVDTMDNEACRISQRSPQEVDRSPTSRLAARPSEGPLRDLRFHG